MRYTALEAILSTNKTASVVINILPICTIRKLLNPPPKQLESWPWVGARLVYIYDILHTLYMIIIII